MYAGSANQNANWIFSKPENVLKDTQNLINTNGKRLTDQSNWETNTAIKIAKLQLQTTENCSDKEKVSHHKMNKHGKEKDVAESYSNKKGSKPVHSSKPSTANTVANILNRIEDEMNKAQNQMNASEIVPVDTSTPKISSNVASNEKNQTEAIEGKFYDAQIFVIWIM